MTELIGRDSELIQASCLPLWRRRLKHEKNMKKHEKNMKGPIQGHMLVGGERVRTRITGLQSWLTEPTACYRTACLRILTTLPWLTDFPAVSKKLTPITRGRKQLKTIHWCYTAKNYKTNPVWRQSSPTCLHSKANYCKNIANKTQSTSTIWLVVPITTNDSLAFYRELTALWKNVTHRICCGLFSLKIAHANVKIRDLNGERRGGGGSGGGCCHADTIPDRRRQRCQWKCLTWLNNRINSPSQWFVWWNGRLGCMR